MRSVLAARRVGRRHRGENRRHSLHPLAKAQVEIPFVPDLERLHAARDGVVGQFLEIGVPMRIHRPVDFKSAADPVEEFFFTAFFRWLRSVMEADESDALVHQAAHRLQVVGLQQRVSAAAVGVDDHRGGAVERGVRIVRPAVGVDHRRDPRPVIQARLQQQAARAMLVFAGAVAGPTRDEHNFLVGRHAFGGGQSTHQHQTHYDSFHGSRPSQFDCLTASFFCK